jgi:hypothetical protein
MQISQEKKRRNKINEQLKWKEIIYFNFIYCLVIKTKTKK